MALHALNCWYIPCNILHRRRWQTWRRKETATPQGPEEMDEKARAIQNGRDGRARTEESRTKSDDGVGNEGREGRKRRERAQHGRGSKFPLLQQRVTLTPPTSISTSASRSSDRGLYEVCSWRRTDSFEVACGPSGGFLIVGKLRNWPPIIMAGKRLLGARSPGDQQGPPSSHDKELRSREQTQTELGRRLLPAKPRAGSVWAIGRKTLSFDQWAGQGDEAQASYAWIANGCSSRMLLY